VTNDLHEQRKTTSINRMSFRLQTHLRQWINARVVDASSSTEAVAEAVGAT